MNFAKFLKTPFSIEHLGWLLPLLILYLQVTEFPNTPQDISFFLLKKKKDLTYMLKLLFFINLLSKDSTKQVIENDDLRSIVNKNISKNK